MAQLAHFLVRRRRNPGTDDATHPRSPRGVAEKHIHPGGDFTDNLPVGFQVPLRPNGFKEALEATVSRREVRLSLLLAP